MAKWENENKITPANKYDCADVARREVLGNWAAQFTAALLTAGKITPSAVCSTALNYALELERLVFGSDLPDL